MKVRELVELLKEHGYGFDRQGKGDHRIYRNETTGRSVSVDGEPGDDIPVGTLKKYLRDAGIKV